MMGDQLHFAIETSMHHARPAVRLHGEIQAAGKNKVRQGYSKRNCQAKPGRAWADA